MKSKIIDDALLPKNRFEQFKETFRFHFFEIVVASAYTFIFSALYFIWLSFLYFFPIFSGKTFFPILLRDGVGAILIGVAGLGFAGGFYYFKKLLFNEGVDINKDFFIGVKKNGKMFFLIFFILGILYLLVHMGIAIIGGLEKSPTVVAILYGILYAVFILCVGIAFYMSALATYFEGSYFNYLINGTKLFFGSILRGIAILLVALIPFFVYEFVPFIIARFIIMAVIAIIYFGLIELLFIQLSNYVYDLGINKNQYPQNYRKGLSKEE